MVEKPNVILRNARDYPKHGQKMSRYQVYQLTGISDDVLRAWEDGKSSPDPDEVDRLSEVYGDLQLWHRWMMSSFDSYRDRFSKAGECSGFSAAITAVKYELQDVLDLQPMAERDSLDGRLDDEKLKNQYLKEIKEAIAALNRAAEWIKAS